MPDLKKIVLKFSFIFSILFIITGNLPCADSLDTKGLTSDFILDGGFDIIPSDDGNFFILSYDKNSEKTALSYLDNTGDTPNIQRLKFLVNREQKDIIDYKYTTANYCNGSLYLTHIEDNKTIIEKYRINLKNKLCAVTNSIVLQGIKIESQKQIAVDSEGVNICFIESTNAGSIDFVTDSGKTDKKLTSPERNFHTIASDISKNYLYALDNFNNMWRYNLGNENYTLERPSSDISIQNFKFLTDNVLVTSDGYICVLNSSEFKFDTKVKSAVEMKNYPTCVAMGFDDSSILVKTEDKVISRIRCSDGAVTGKIELTENILAISNSDNKIIVVTGGENNKIINLISNSDIVEVIPPKPEVPDEGEGEPKPNPDPDDNQEKEPSDENDDDSITSDIHQIDLENHIISEIPVGTTFAEFKNNLIFNGYSLVFKDINGKVKTGNSTKIGTGYTVTFVKDGTERGSFKLVVQGDLTGSGTLTSRDISTFTNYLLGKTNLDGLYLQAANINEDGEADAIDLFLMYKMLQK